ncbi:MAG TPA: radical SAM protein [Bacillota bacterium]|nr:radical SAM protein [Bacillota bacterium]HOL09531.1 radical SAM protein [Bacillota bacterium]HPO97498.1 radical SAM protein [Bacillota bacterium]
MALALQKENEARSNLSYFEVVREHPDVPPLVILKMDVQRRGVHYTKKALSAVDESVHQLRSPYIFGSRDAQIKPVPESLLLRDGTSILVDPTPLEQNPYVVDVIDGQVVLTDQGEVLETVEYWPKPDFYDKKTSSGVLMSHIISARPQRLNIFQSGFCHFWANDKGCRYCDIVTHFKQQRAELGIPAKLSPQDVFETMQEALKQPGRFTGICLTSGSDTRGAEPFDQEVDFYIEILQAIGANFKVKKFPSQLIASAFTEKQLARLYEETGLTSYTADLEVLNEELFNWICPGKAEWIGYREWKNRLIRAVDIFGRGNVSTGIVGGVETAKPKGFGSEEAALQSTLTEAEDLISQGVNVAFIVWVPRPGSYFRDQKNPSLDYFVRLAKGLHQLRVKYSLPIDFDDYRRCGNHPDTDLSRLL